MFTGLVDHCGEIISAERIHGLTRLTINSDFSEMDLGESIAVDGICLTVTTRKPGQFTCELSSETIAVTTANRFVPGYKVNLERALTLSQRVGGHLLLGHVDKMYSLTTKTDAGNCMIMTFSGVSTEDLPLLAKKGCIAINGVSLTLNAVNQTSIEVMVIPHTLTHTNLEYLQISDKVNVEFDYLARIIARQIEVRGFVS